MSNKKENRLKYLCTISLTISNEGRKHEFFKKKFCEIHPILSNSKIKREKYFVIKIFFPVDWFHFFFHYRCSRWHADQKRI